MKQNRLTIFLYTLFVIVFLWGCNTPEENNSSNEADLSIVRQFIGTDSLNNNDYMLLKQNGYGVISEWICYDENDEIYARIECKYEGIFMKEKVTYNADGTISHRIVYEREPDGKLISRKIYRPDEPVSTLYYKEENDNMPATDKDVCIVRYDELGRAIRWKSINYDGSEELTITEYDEYGWKSETTYLDGEVDCRLEFVPKK